MAMKLVKKTAEYTIYQRGDDRYAVKDANKNAVNGDEKVRILVAEEALGDHRYHADLQVLLLFQQGNACQQGGCQFFQHAPAGKIVGVDMHCHAGLG